MHRKKISKTHQTVLQIDKEKKFLDTKKALLRVIGRTD